MQKSPTVVAAVLTAREERLREIALSDEVERLKREQETVEKAQEDLVRETETAERGQEEMAWVQKRAVTLATSWLGRQRATFTAETYAPPEAHLFVPSGIDSCEPLQDSYDAELVLRDPRHHLSVSWEQRVRELVDAAGFGPFIQTMMAMKSDHALLTALAERWWDTSNSFHFPIGEMTMTPTDFAAITGLRVGGDPIPFDSGINGDKEALRWFLGHVPTGSAEMVPYKPFRQYLRNRFPASELEEEQMARAYLL
ncbi:hypothetical protein RHMOL_Rhmol09G0095900 [Rhododendron molle]|uniref:Uncharacterized protein n=1 Tax=Rhododendron molle TaxID=49168 RepID=A0ACC0MDH5_RHOML|nr:hypothetical protein RHMOL_Rhmol09G0095900 [Rhododendron molle]